MSQMMTFDEFNEIVGLGELRSREQALLDFAKKSVTNSEKNLLPNNQRINP
jgi:hypothetical protein